MRSKVTSITRLQPEGLSHMLNQEHVTFPIAWSMPAIRAMFAAIERRLGDTFGALRDAVGAMRYAGKNRTG